jgi:hypothetical protein
LRSLSFLSFTYYGKVIGSIRDALRARGQFHIGPHDAAKITTYIEFLGANHPEVKEFISYDRNTSHIENNTETLKEMFHKEYLLADTSPKRAWLYESLFRRIQNKAQLDRSARDLLYDQAKVVYCDYHYHLYLHGRMIFTLMRERTAPSNDTTANSAKPMVVGHKLGAELVFFLGNPLSCLVLV